MNDFDEAVLDASIASIADWDEHANLATDHHPTCELHQDFGGCTCPADWAPGVDLVVRPA